MMSQSTDIDWQQLLPEYLVVRKLLEQAQPLIFVSGSAGTGKSTLIEWIQQQFAEQCLVVAPTAMAALNVKGCTIHSLCQFPPTWILDKDIYNLSYRKPELKQAKILIIDEISMVNANLFDAMDKFFQKNRRNSQPFGGLSVLIVGDLFQLPPIVGDNVRALFQQHYATEYFFSANCWLNNSSKYIELTKVFRQSDGHFVNILQNIREGKELLQAINFLNTQCRITTTPEDLAVYLSPRIKQVDLINQTKLAAIQQPAKTYVGKIKQKFKADRLPSPQQLVLKVGAQVMFSKNAFGGLNGTVGTVKALLDDYVLVEVVDEIQHKQLLEVRTSLWEDYQFAIDPATGKVTRDIVGTYEQIPLMLAWAITIHKSQGKTLNKVHLDLGSGAFTTGQTYVALSRCKFYAGLSFSRHLLLRDIIVDKRVRDFYAQSPSALKQR